jgi:glutaredoxin
MEDKWIVFTGPRCAYCPQAKALLTAKGIEFEEVVIDSREKFLFMEQHAPGIKSVPTMVVNGKVIIGYEGLKEHFDQTA